MPIHVVDPTARLLSARVRALVDQALETCDRELTDLGSAFFGL